MANIQHIADRIFRHVAIDACEAAQLMELGPMTRLLASVAAQMVDNALRTVTRRENHE